MQAKPVKKKSKAVQKPVSKKKIKKPFEEDLIPLTRLNRSIDEKHNLLFENDSKNLSKKSTTGPVIVRKKIQSERVIPQNDKKIKSKKVDKVVTTVTGNPPKPPSASKKKKAETPTASQLYSEPQISNEM